ncbi:hypothetical protein Agub_g12286 [Astrephomene gubernaculifera]|uniref:Uncharacterized protein n=1 Tax=Astrephomene gubernaculifera TaxID=47775 RepID=A0AAD3HQJ6_9CHLO|nr:hypothetical protein Agub_g12286 [Astrephomene gubernaculifera]
MVPGQYINAPNGASAAHGARGESGRRMLVRDHHRLIFECTEKLLSNPKHTHAMRERAQSYRMLGDDDAALADYETLLALEPNNVDALFYRGTILEKRRDVEDAIRCYTAVLELEPQHHKALYNRAVCYSAKGSFQQAIEDFNAALQLDQEASKGDRRLQQQQMPNPFPSTMTTPLAAILGDHPPPEHASSQPQPPSRQQQQQPQHHVSADGMGFPHTTSFPDLSASGWDRRNSTASPWSTTPFSTTPGSLDEDAGTTADPSAIASVGAAALDEVCGDASGSLTPGSFFNPVHRKASCGSFGKRERGNEGAAAANNAGPQQPSVAVGNDETQPMQAQGLQAVPPMDSPVASVGAAGSAAAAPQGASLEAASALVREHAPRVSHNPEPRREPLEQDGNHADQRRQQLHQQHRRRLGPGSSGICERAGSRGGSNGSLHDSLGSWLEQQPSGGMVRASPELSGCVASPQGQLSSGEVTQEDSVGGGGAASEASGCGSAVGGQLPAQGQSSQSRLQQGHRQPQLPGRHQQQLQGNVEKPDAAGQVHGQDLQGPGGTRQEQREQRELSQMPVAMQAHTFLQQSKDTYHHDQLRHHQTASAAAAAAAGATASSVFGRLQGLHHPQQQRSQAPLRQHPQEQQPQPPLLQPHSHVGDGGSAGFLSAGKGHELRSPSPFERILHSDCSSGGTGSRNTPVTHSRETYALSQSQHYHHQQHEALAGEPRAHRQGQYLMAGQHGRVAGPNEPAASSQQQSHEARQYPQGNMGVDSSDSCGDVSSDSHAASSSSSAFPVKQRQQEQQLSGNQHPQQQQSTVAQVRRQLHGGDVSSERRNGGGAAANGTVMEAAAVGTAFDPWVVDGMSAALEMSRPSTSSSGTSDATDPGNRNKVLEQYNARAFALRQQGKLLEALREYTRALEVDPCHFKTLFNRGFTYDRLGDLAAAVEDYTQALVADPHSSYAYYNRGITRDRLQDFAGAVEDFTVAIRLEPTNADFYHNRGFALRKQGLFEAAIQDYTAAIQLNPSHCRAYYNRAFCHDRLNHVQQAIDDYTRALEMEPNNATALHNRGSLHERNGRSDLAIQDFNRAIAADPGCAQSYNARGVLLQSCGRLEEALQDLDAAIALMQPPSATVFRNRAQARRELGDHEGAVQDLTRAITLDPSDLLSYSRRAHCYRRMGQFESAIRDYTRAITLSPRNAKLHTIRAYCYAMMGWFGEAVADYDVVLALEPGNSHAMYNRSIALEKLGGALDRAAASAAASGTMLSGVGGGGGAASADQQRRRRLSERIAPSSANSRSQGGPPSLALQLQQQLQLQEQQQQSHQNRQQHQQAWAYNEGRLLAQSLPATAGACHSEPSMHRFGGVKPSTVAAVAAALAGNGTPPSWFPGAAATAAVATTGPHTSNRSQVPSYSPHSSATTGGSSGADGSATGGGGSSCGSAAAPVASRQCHSMHQQQHYQHHQQQHYYQQQQQHYQQQQHQQQGMRPQSQSQQWHALPNGSGNGGRSRTPHRAVAVP